MSKIKGQDKLAKVMAKFRGYDLDSKESLDFTDGFRDGFNKHKEMTAEMLMAFGKPELMMIAHLVKAIGTALVEESEEKTK